MCQKIFQFKKSIFYFSKYSHIGPSSRERIYCYIESLKKSGFEVKINYLLGEYYFNYLNKEKNNLFDKILIAFYLFFRYVNRMFFLIKARKIDVIIIEQELLPFINFYLEKFLIEKLVGIKNKKIGIEFDDAIYLTKHKTQKIPKLLKFVNFAIVGNKNLKKYANEYNSKIFEIPTGVDIIDTSLTANIKKNVIIGWTGLAYNLKYLETILKILAQLQKEYQIEIIIVCNKIPKIENLKFKFVQWSEIVETEILNEIDIGVMPLANDEWCAGKCGYKLLRYMACGKSSVASAVGVNIEIIKNGENGFLAATDKEWYDSLRLLIENKELREKIGKNARLTVEQKYSKKIIFEKLLKTLNEI